MDSATKLVPLVMVQTKGCPEYLCNSAIRKAFNAICLQTDCWRKEFEFTVTTVEEDAHGRAIITLPDVGYDAAIIRIFDVYIKDYNATTATYGEIRKLSPKSFQLQLSENFRLVLNSAYELITGDKVIVDMALAPNEVGVSLTDIPAGIVQLCSSAVVPLAIGNLCQMTGRPWHDAETARYNHLEATNAIRQIIFNVSNGSTNESSSAPVSGMIEG